MDTFKERLAKAMRRMNITQAELCAMTGISRSTMSQYYSGAFRPKEDKLRRIAKALEVNEAWLLGYENPNSTAELVEKFPNIRPVHLKQFPILGEIACGKPIFAEEERGSFLMASDEIHADFCLLAHGDSMTGARIYDGDAVFIRSQPMVENCEIAAVIINDEATLKRVYFDRKQARLQLVAENPAYPPLVYVGEELETVHILGKAIAFMSLL